MMTTPFRIKHYPLGYRVEYFRKRWFTAKWMPFWSDYYASFGAALDGLLDYMNQEQVNESMR